MSESILSQLLEQAEANRQYWQQRNAARFEQIANKPHRLEHQAIWEKLEDSETYRV